MAQLKLLKTIGGKTFEVNSSAVDEEGEMMSFEVI